MFLNCLWRVKALKFRTGQIQNLIITEFPVELVSSNKVVINMVSGIEIKTNRAALST